MTRGGRTGGGARSASRLAAGLRRLLGTPPTLQALLSGVGRAALGRAAFPVASAVAAAAFCGALLGGGRLGPAGNPAAAPGIASALAAPLVALLAAALAWAEVAAASAAQAQRLDDLQARGASPLQARLLAAGPAAAWALACALVLPVPAALLAAAAPLHAFGRGLGPILGGAWAAAVPAGLVLTVLLLCAPRLPAPHPRALAAPAVRPGRRWWQGGALVLCCGACGLAVDAAARGQGGGLLLAPLAYAGAAGFVLGAALLALRAAAAAARALGHRLPGADAGVILALRSAGRGAGAVWPVALAALSAAAVTFALSGGPAAGAAGAAYRAMTAGADARVEVVVPRPCGSSCQGYDATFRGWPLPDVEGYAADQLPAVAAAAVLVPGSDRVSLGAAGSVPATTWGLDAAAFGAVADWPSGVPGPADLRLLEADGHGVVVSSALAAAAGLRPGERIQTQLLGVVPVLAVVPSWPGVGTASPDWLVTTWGALAPGLQGHQPWTSQGFTFFELWQLEPGADVHQGLAALRRRGVTTPLTFTPSAASAGTGALPLVLWPLAALAAWLWWRGRGLRPEDPRGLPDPEAALALGSAPAAERARALLLAGGAAWGGAWGALCGWAAAALFWPALAFGTAAGASAAALRPPPLGLWLAVLICVGGAYAVSRALRAVPAEPGNPRIAARVAERALGRPEPPEVSAEPRWAPPRRIAPWAAAPWGAGPAGRPAARGTLPRRWGVGVLALAGPALQRLRFSWPRLVGLAAGLLLAAAVSATVPLYVTGSLTRVLQAGLAPVNSRPAGAALVRFLPTATQTYTQADLARLSAATAGLGAQVGLPATPLTSYEATSGGEVDKVSAASGAAVSGGYVGSMTIDSLSDLSLHITITSGQLYADAPDADGAIEAMVADSAYASLGLRLGGLYSFTPPGGAPALTLRLVGVFQQVDPTGPYWPYRYYTSDWLISPAAFQQAVFQDQTVPLGEASWYTTLDLGALNAESVSAAAAALQHASLGLSAVLPGAQLIVSPYAALTAFLQRAATLQALLRIVSIPVIALSLYFVAITAGLIVEAEAGEIAVYVSRGAGAAHILALYLLEWCMLAVPVALLAPFPAAAFARMMGSANGFLHFVPGPVLPVLVTRADFAYSGAAALAGVVTALVPVAHAVGRSIIAARLRSARATQVPLWQRAYLDVAALAVMAVLWLSFRSASLQQGSGAAAIAGDPGLYLLPAAFLAVSGLLVVRLVGWGFNALEGLIGDWAALGVVIPLRRIGRLPAQFAPVLLLLCFTAALGSYSAAAARTMDGNLASSVEYRVGAPLRLDEISPCETEEPEAGACVTYDPAPVSASRGIRPMPPFSLHAGSPGIAAATELLNEPVGIAGSAASLSATLVLVDPATYAQVGWWTDGLDALPLQAYLQTLAAHPGAIFLSPGLLTAERSPTGTQLQVTDSLSATGASSTFTVAGAVSRWPGAQANQPFAVAALGPAEAALGIVEGERIALIRPVPGATPAQIEAGLASRGILTATADVTSTEVQAALSTPEWAGQSGLLSVGFLVALAVTAAGYLFYAALLLRGQLSQLGLLRALGLPWGRLVAAVAAEQGALLAVGALCGTAAGVLAAALFLPLFRPAFTGPGSPPFVSSGPGPALGEVAGLMAALMLAALATLLGLLRRMHVGETVKLEE